MGVGVGLSGAGVSVGAACAGLLVGTGVASDMAVGVVVSVVADGTAADDFVAVGAFAVTSVGVGAGATLPDDSPSAGSVLAPHANNVAINTPSTATSRYFAGPAPAAALLS